MMIAGCDQCPSMAGISLGFASAASSNKSTGWAETFQDMLKSWSRAGQQILINLNQPLEMETGPGGTKVYQRQATGGTPLPPGFRSSTEPTTPAENIAGMGFSTAILIAGIIALVLITRKGDD
jgi:hypothetical protein